MSVSDMNVSWSSVPTNRSCKTTTENSAFLTSINSARVQRPVSFVLHMLYMILSMVFVFLLCFIRLGRTTCSTCCQQHCLQTLCSCCSHLSSNRKKIHTCGNIFNPALFILNLCHGLAFYCILEASIVSVRGYQDENERKLSSKLYNSHCNG